MNEKEKEMQEETTIIRRRKRKITVKEMRRRNEVESEVDSRLGKPYLCELLL